MTDEQQDKTEESAQVPRPIAESKSSAADQEESFDNLQLDTEISGAFIDSLKRNNKKIREDRALAIAEDAQLIYKRKIEDLKMGIRKLHRARENMLDLSPTTAQSLILAEDFDASEYVEKDLKYGYEIRNEEIKLAIALKHYNFLFGKGGN